MSRFRGMTCRFGRPQSIVDACVEHVLSFNGRDMILGWRARYPFKFHLNCRPGPGPTA